MTAETQDPIKVEIANILKDAREGGKDVAEFIKTEGIKAVEIVQEQAPEVFKEIVYLQATKSAIPCFGFLCVFIVLCYVYKRVVGYAALNWKAEHIQDAYERSGAEVGGAFTFVLFHTALITSFSVWLVYLNDLIQIIVAPRITVLTFIIDLFK